ncbi:MAG: hypothetical protein EVA89_12105 [Sandaracinaceae bacterium]|nr:MAG: hypothetical protein EVA89_12105 [Sandaracinaceae bacterium]
MSAAEDFDDAIAQALERGQRHDEALNLVKDLTNQLAQSVAKQTGGAVEIVLVNEEDAQTAIHKFNDAMTELAAHSGARRRRLGGDSEDRQSRQFVLARSKQDPTASRILWEVEIDHDGFPVTVRGPEEGHAVSCWTDDDLRERFVAAAGSGLVGRKIAALKTP